MFGFGKKRLSISDKEYELIEEKLYNLFKARKVEVVDESFLVAGATSVFIKKYRVDNKTLTISFSDDGVVDIVGAKSIVDSINSYIIPRR